MKYSLYNSCKAFIFLLSSITELFQSPSYYVWLHGTFVFPSGSFYLSLSNRRCIILLPISTGPTFCLQGLLKGKLAQTRLLLAASADRIRSILASSRLELTLGLKYLTYKEIIHKKLYISHVCGKQITDHDLVVYCSNSEAYNAVWDHSWRWEVPWYQTLWMC